MTVYLGKKAITVLKKYMKDKFTLRKVTRGEDSDWGQPAISYTEYEIRGVAYPINYEDLTFYPPGVVKEGDIQITFLPKYKIGDEEVVPENFDRIVYGGAEFEIRNVRDMVDGNVTIARTAFGRRLE